MKKQALVNIKFVHNGKAYLARVYEHRPTAIILPNKTVLVTQTNIFIANGTRKGLEEQTHVRQIFYVKGGPVLTKVRYRPGNWDRPLEIHFPLVFATYDPSQF